MLFLDLLLGTDDVPMRSIIRRQLVCAKLRNFTHLSSQPDVVITLVHDVAAVLFFVHDVVVAQQQQQSPVRFRHRSAGNDRRRRLCHQRTGNDVTPCNRRANVQ